MIARIWHGYTTPENADAYDEMLQREIFSGISNRSIEGYKGINLLRREVNNEVEFITIMWFATMDAVKKFAGENFSKAVIYEKAKPLLTGYDEESQHYEVIH
jgi:heme-degrading monooxygenase HmoA